MVRRPAAADVPPRRGRQDKPTLWGELPNKSNLELPTVPRVLKPDLEPAVTERSKPKVHKHLKLLSF